VKYKTSIYGWGKLQHPVKAQAQPPQKKKKKWVDPTENMQLPPPPPPAPPSTTQKKSAQKESANEQRGAASSVLPIPKAKGNSTSKSVENLPTVGRLKAEDAGTRLARILKRKSVPNNSSPIPTRSTEPGKETGSGFTGKWISKPFRTDNTSKGIHPNPKEIKSPPTTPALVNGKGSGPTYYGQYRCGKCTRYWRSALARDGLSQKCSKCGTPTFPRKNLKVKNCL